MRKAVGRAFLGGDLESAQESWRDLRQISRVLVSSEDPNHPIESLFSFGKGPGWRAGCGGEQTIRLVFDRPQRIKRIWLRFSETKTERTQEFTLRWSTGPEQFRREIVRQQWTFSPNGSTVEIEDYQVDLHSVAALELNINPGLTRHDALATMEEWRLG